MPGRHGRAVVAVALALATSAGAAEPRTIVIDAHGSHGPPSSTCKQDLAEAPEAAQWPRHRPARASSGKPAPPEVKLLILDGVEVPVADHPASDPGALPAVPLRGPDSARATLAAVWARASAGTPVRISVFGASHTEGDYWTGHLRRTLQDRWGDRGHGFVMPAPIAAGYRGQDVNLCASNGWLPDYVGKSGGLGDGLYGFMGASVRSALPAAFGWVETTRSNPHGRRASRVDVYALGAPDAGALALTVDDAPPRIVPLAAERPELVRLRIEADDGPHRVQVSPAGEAEVRVFGASLERDGAGVIVDAMGIRGREARTWLKWDEGLLAAGLSALAPDLVVLAYGTNESADTDYALDTYRADLHAVLTRLRGLVGEQVACVLVGPSDIVKRNAKQRYVPNPRVAQVAAVQAEVGPAHGCLTWDWQAATGGPGSMLALYEHDPKLAAGDLVHFRKAGYEWSADRFLGALDEAAASGSVPPAR